ncbi:hypothetical protein F5Y01DRAFT_300310 [Xylaria sp. FL0043]|nr:hypothetical protein F5Y01DRAFT_300310 [Xylaria sp. FL0043]
MKFGTALFLLARMVCAQGPVTTAAPSQTVVNVFLGAKRSSSYLFDGRIIVADATATTFEIQCKSGVLNLPGFPTTTCDPANDPPWTVTYGSSTMIGVIPTAIGTVTALLAETCALEARTAAYCNYTFVEDIGSSSTTTSYPTVITGDSYTEYPITITAGLQNLVTSTTNVTQPSETPLTIPISMGSVASMGGGFKVVLLAISILFLL